MRIDHVVNRDQEQEYDEKLMYYRSKIEAKGGFFKVGDEHPYMINYRKYQNQPYHWYKKELWQSLRTKYTKENVLKLVNTLFDCNFTELVVDYCHLTTDDYVSKSPN